MIASMDSQWDFNIFFNNTEITKLKNKQKLEGIVVHLNRPHIQEPIKIYINYKNIYANAGGLDLIEFKKEYVFEMSEIAYSFLQSNFEFGARYHGGRDGSKFKLINIEKTEDFFNKQRFKDIQFCIENQENYKKRFEEEGF